MSRAVAHVAASLLGDAHFLYTAFAPVARNSRADDRPRDDDAREVLVKVGISTAPMRRLVSVHHNSPFRVAYAAFAPTYSGKRGAERIESRLLSQFKDHRTRGEWLLLPNTSEVRQEFARAARVLLQAETSQPVIWTRVSGNDLAKHAIQPGRKRP